MPNGADSVPVWRFSVLSEADSTLLSLPTTGRSGQRATPPDDDGQTSASLLDTSSMQATKLRDDAKLERRQDANAAHVAHVDVELPCLEAPPVVVRGCASARLDHRSCPDVAAHPSCSLARCQPAQGLVRAMVVEPRSCEGDRPT